MGLDIGVPRTRWLALPRGPIYKFAWFLNEEASWDMGEGIGLFAHGSDNNYAWFERKAVMRLLRQFSKDNQLSRAERAELRAWVDSLPWEDDHIELHFNW